MRAERIPAAVWWMLAARTLLFAGLQLAAAAILAVVGVQEPLTASADWWLWIVSAANLACIVLLARLARGEGLRFRDLFGFRGSGWRRDLVVLAPALVVTGPIAMLPNLLLARVLFGSAEVPGAMLFRPLPVAAVYPLLLLMPITQALAELPVYFGYVAPRLRRAGLNRWAVIVLVGTTLGLQHLFLGFRADWRYGVWHGLMFLPFALWVAFLLDRRPSLLPYLLVVHGLLDASLPYLVLLASRR